MSEFTGMALYSQSDIKVALTNYLAYSTGVVKEVHAAVDSAESNYRPSLWNKLLGKTELKDMRSRFSFMSYEAELAHTGYISFDLYFKYEVLIAFGKSYNSIHDLYGSGRDCYLTPSQAKFVNKFKDMEVL